MPRNDELLVLANADLDDFEYVAPMLSLMISGFDADPSRVTEILGLTPTIARRAGEPTPNGRPSRASLWLYTMDGPEVQSGGSHAEALKGLLDVIASRGQGFADVRRELNPKTMTITGGFYFSAGEQTGLWLDPDDMRLLADAGIGWGVDIYLTNNGT